METIIKLCFVLAAAFISAAEKGGSGPVGPVIIYSIEECADPVNMVGFQASIGKKDDKTVLDMSFDLGVDMADDNVKVNVVADRYDSDKGEWEKDAHTYKDQDFFNFFNKFIPDIWENLRGKISPKIEESTLIPAGEYSLEDFTADYNDFKGQLFYDNLNATVDIIHEGEKILCLNIKLECFPPKKG